jgi:ferrochelatase
MEAFLLISYGAPFVGADVIPFLERLFANKNVAQNHVEKAALKYYEFAKRNGGKFSPLNDQCCELLFGIESEFSDVGLPIRVYLGNLYWRPFLEDTIAKMADDGVTFANSFITSAFDSTAGNRRYSFAIESACRKVGGRSPLIKRLPLPFDQPLFIQSQAKRLCEKFLSQKNNTQHQSETLIFFTAHSIPKSDPFVENYVGQLNFVCSAVIERCCLICPDLRGAKWELLYQSQPIDAGNSDQFSQWLSPAIKDKITTLVQQSAENGINATKNVIISPIGFFCESMETVNDLDFELGDICRNSPVKLIRVSTVGTMPEIFKMIVKLAGENS